jgi:adenosylcobinamide-GDP ribazoletransferase
MSLLRPLFAALRFLTRLPVPDPYPLSDTETGRVPLFYPLAGLAIGLLLALLQLLLADLPAALQAALLLAAWVLLTGGLHLDGLADSADAWVGGLGDRERTLAIMKDPYTGSAGVSALVILLLVKFAALQTLVECSCWPVLLMVPVIARAGLLTLLLTTPYVRAGGMGDAAARHLDRWTGGLVVAAVAVGVLLEAGKMGIWLLAAAGAAFFWVRFAILRRIGGTTGDTAGALVEISEMTLLGAAVATSITP